jgi:predicted DNA-binding protein
MLAFAAITRHSSSVAAITHRIDNALKAELDRFCDEHGLKQQAVVSEAIASWLEDAEDLALIEERRGGPWVEWSDVRETL